MAKKQIKEESKVKLYSPKIWYVFFIFLAFLFYGNSIKNGYSMDDEYVTTTDKQQNKLTELGITGIGKIFTSHSFIDGKQSYEYRPVSMYTFAIEWSLFKNSDKRVHISHFINILLYGFIGIALFKLLQILTQKKSFLFSILVTFLFLIHPIHSEVVNSIKNRDEMLSLLFALIGAIYTFKWIDSKRIYFIFLAGIMILLSMLSKKSNLPFIVTIPLMLYFFRNIQLKTVGFTFVVLFSVKVFFNLFRNHLMNLDETTNRQFSTFENPLFDLGFIERIPMFFYTNLVYVQKLILPYPLAYYYGFDAIPLIGFNNWQFYIGVIVMLIILYFAFKGLVKKSVLSFGIFFFLLAIGGVLNLLSPMVGIVAERFTFSASIGFCIVLVYLLFKWKPKLYESNQLSFSTLAPFLIILIPCFLYSINRNQDWESKKSLYLADIKTLSSSAKANSLLASEYQVEAMNLQKEGAISYSELMQKVDSAIYYYDQSLKIYKKYESNLNNKGVLLYTFHYDYGNALELFQFSIKFNNKYKEGYLNCGNAHAKFAEIYHDLSIILAPYDSSQVTSNEELQTFEKTFIDAKYYQSIAILKQFEINLKTFYSSNQGKDIKPKIIENSSNLESLSKQLIEKSFAAKINKCLNSGSPPINEVYKNILLITNGIKQELLNEATRKSQVSLPKQRKILETLKKQHVKSAKENFKITFQLSKDEKSYFNIVSQMAKAAQDYEWIAEIQEQYIKTHSSEYLAKNYSELINAFVISKNIEKAKINCKILIQTEEKFISKHKTDFLGEQYVRMANAYLTLGENERSIEYFKKGAQEFKREKSALEQKENKSQQESQRIEILKREIENLKRFKESLMSKKQTK